MLKVSIRGSSLFPQVNVKQTYCEETNGDVKLENIAVNLTGSLDNMLNLRTFYQLGLFYLKAINNRSLFEYTVIFPQRI